MSRTGALQLAITTAVLAICGATAQAQQVGTASAVNPAATANLKTIIIGQSISHKERIQTKSSGSVQLLFLDKTSMTIGPNSDLTIDEYVYDPSANTGKLAATLSKGALRFVGGQISHNGDAEIKTASATIGIRGGVMMTDGKGGIYAGYGTSTVTSGGRSVTLHAGEFTQIHAGGPPSLPNFPPPGFVQRQIALFQSAVGQTGGTRRGAASQQNVAAAEHRATGSPGGFVTGSGGPPAPPTPVAGLISAITSAFQQSAQTSSQSTAVQQISQSTDNNPPPNNSQPPASTEARPSVTLTGYAGGMDIIVAGQTVTTRSVTGTASVGLDAAANAAQASLTVSDPNNPQIPARTFQFGPTSGGYIDYANFAAVSNNGVVVSTNSAPLSQVVSGSIPNLTPCQCDYTRWGFWLYQPTSTTSQTAPPTETVIGTWVAGRPVQISDIPTTGTATYTGHVIASIQNTGFAAGGFSNTVNFGTRTGAVTVTNLDSTNYAGNVSFNSTDPRNFGGTIAGNTGGRSMALQGSFFQGASSPVGEMGGSVAISGANNYVGSGTFAAARH
ncbi:MAG TPA: FecR domain-containing protein [Nitrobacter sp.]|nr:FecR domain-containing protein [Nitrobacter sp.]